ncbi:MAG: hypothetical protein HGA45_28995 [Chloroflexales bacterium]|nr:hypothetical protein [Chloroflexales bacterium]
MQLSSAEASCFNAVVVQLHEESSALPRALCALAAPTLERLVAGEFSQIAALLPWWLAEIVPLPDDRCAVLGRAGLYAWWHGQIHDEIIDGGLTPDALPLAQHTFTQTLNGYAALGLLAGAPWANLAARLEASAAAYAEEVSARPVDPATVSDELLAAWTPDLLMDRAAPFGFTVTAHLHLACVPGDDRRWEDLPAAVRCLTGARQIADDASDWLDDLRAAQLNWVSARLIRDFRANASAAAEGTLERLAGYELRAERSWEEVERTYNALCCQAIQRLAPYGNCRLSALVQAQRDHDITIFAQLRERRARLCALFGLGAYGG